MQLYCIPCRFELGNLIKIKKPLIGIIGVFFEAFIFVIFGQEIEQFYIKEDNEEILLDIVSQIVKDRRVFLIGFSLSYNYKFLVDLRLEFYQTVIFDR